MEGPKCLVTMRGVKQCAEHIFETFPLGKFCSELITARPHHFIMAEYSFECRGKEVFGKRRTIMSIDG